MPDSELTMNGAAVRISPAKLSVLLGGPIAIAIGCWIYLGIMLKDMSVIPGMSSLMMMPKMFDPLQLFGLFAMWTVMMAAMMLPTAVPMIAAYARMRSAERRSRAEWISVLSLASGYVTAWAAFSLGAALLQAGLTRGAYLLPMKMQVVSGPLSAGILVAIGIYQLLPLKQACLRQCRSPLGFLMTQWRNGEWGAFVMGWRHGLFCVGCCWALMGLLFVAGVMNVVWIILITIYVLIEKIVPNSQIISKLVGAGMIGSGIWLIFA